MRHGKFKQNTDLSKDMFATIGGVKGNQFGNDVYSTVLKFKDLSEFLDVFPSVQRHLNRNRINSIKRYIISGLENKDNMRFFSSVTATCKGTILYDDERLRVAIDTRSKMSLNDGQHRFEAIKLSIAEIESKIKKHERDITLRDNYKAQLEELQNMVVPVIIFDGLDERDEKQLFYDLNSLAQRPSKSANIKLSQTDLFARMSREISEENRYLKHYGVEMDKTIIGKNNPNTFLLTSLHSSIKTLVKDELTNENFDETKEYVSDTFDKLFFILPNDIGTRGMYILDKNYALVGLSKFIAESRESMLIEEDEIFETIAGADFTNNIDIYGKYGGLVGHSGTIIFNSSSSGIKAIYSYMNDLLESKQKPKAKSKSKSKTKELKDEAEEEVKIS